MKLDPIEEVIAEVRVGRPIVMVDDDDRENEGDIVVAAEKITPELVNFMIREAKGLICLSLTQDRFKELSIPMQVTENTAVYGTNFGVSFDHRSVVEFGVSASGRAKTILKAVSDSARAQDFLMPGYVFPLAAVPGGVLKRRGQTEGSVDISRLAGLKPAGVICEIMDSEGQMISGTGIENYCKKHKLKLTSVEEVVQYRLQHEVSLRRVAETEVVDQQVGTLKVVVYIDDVDDKEQLAFIKGDPKDGALVRIHSECLTGDVFGSQRCDCGNQFQHALKNINEVGEGVVVYLHQEGRGIGLGNKLRAYALQDQGRDTVDANIELGFEADGRDYRAGAQIIADLGLTKVKLMTNNPAKLEALESFGISVTERVPLVFCEEDNRDYLDAKRDKMGHLIP